MKPPTPALLDLLAQAADLRSGGASWEAVAAQVGRSADTCRRWPALYPDDWRRLYAAAEERLVVEASAESVLVLRKLLRAEDEKIRRDVARLLVTMRLELRALETRAAKAAALPESDAGRIAGFLAERSDADVQGLVEELLRRRADPAEGGT
jgi:hypothetical protein